MAERLDCCVVRDLLPTYIEELTEPETTVLVQAHLESCPTCLAMERDMRSTIPVARTPKRELKFLQRMKRTQLIAVLLTAAVTLGCIWWGYELAYPYPNTEAGRLAAVEEYIPQDANSTIQHGVEEGTPLHVVGWTEWENHLFLFYVADNEENVHGDVHLVRGLNGKYLPLDAGISPSEFCAGVFAGQLHPKGTDWKLFYLAGYHCRDIYRVDVELEAYNPVKDRREVLVRSVDISGEDFFTVMDRAELEEVMGPIPDELTEIYVRDMTFFDKDGNDITDQYREDVDANWSGGKGTAETFMIYVYVGIIALLGLLLGRYFWWQD